MASTGIVVIKLSVVTGVQRVPYEVGEAELLDDSELLPDDVDLANAPVPVKPVPLPETPTGGNTPADTELLLDDDAVFNGMETIPVPAKFVEVEGVGYSGLKEDVEAVILPLMLDEAYFQNDVGSDGKKNKTGPLVNGDGKRFEIKMTNGQYFPGLMYVDSPQTGWYEPHETDPSKGACGIKDSLQVLAFTSTTGIGPLDGITMCPDFFDLALTSSLGEPNEDVTDTTEIDKFVNSAGSAMLHEMVHLASANGIIDVNAAFPPEDANGQSNWQNRNWAQWTLNSEHWTYGYTPSVYLGLSMPNWALKNAENYAVLAICLKYEELDCLGTFQDSIKKKRRIPFEVASRTIEKIRFGKMDLLTDFD